MRELYLEPINRCIYCPKDTGLTDEHLIPYFMYGQLVLPKASCPTCSSITSKIEDFVGRRHFGIVRSYNKMRTRRPGKRIKNVDMWVVRGDARQRITVPVEEFGSIFLLPQFLPPGRLTEERLEGPRLTGYISWTQGGMSHPEQLLKKYAVGADGLDFDFVDRPVDFARMLAKVAHGLMVATWGLENIEESFVVPAILGTSTDIGTWVGGDERRATDREEFYSFEVRGPDVRARMRLFGAVPDSPTYQVVVGRLKPGATKRIADEKWVEMWQTVAHDQREMEEGVAAADVLSESGNTATRQHGSETSENLKSEWGVKTVSGGANEGRQVAHQSVNSGIV